MIVGLGIDLCEVPRVASMLARWGSRFTDKIFTPGERDYSLARGQPAIHLAARFAAKEAALKALAVPPGLSWHELEVVGGGKQAPRMVLGGRAAAAAEALGMVRLHLTLTHTAEVAAAVVILEARDG